MKREKILISGIVIAMLSLIIGLVIGYSSNEYYPLIPGWHTVIYPIESMIIVVALVILTMTLIIALLYNPERAYFQRTKN
jgi:NADH:ubiquinone oxidoreductase subunit H